MPTTAINSAQITTTQVTTPVATTPVATTRRSALTAGAAMVGTAGTGLLAGPAFASGVTGGSPGARAALPVVYPMSSQRVQQNYGVCDHPDFTEGLPEPRRRHRSSRGHAGRLHPRDVPHRCQGRGHHRTAARQRHEAG